MLYDCTHMATVGVKGLNVLTTHVTVCICHADLKGSFTLLYRIQ